MSDGGVARIEMLSVHSLRFIVRSCRSARAQICIDLLAINKLHRGCAKLLASFLKTFVSSK